MAPEIDKAGSDSAAKSAEKTEGGDAADNIRNAPDLVPAGSWRETRSWKDIFAPPDKPGSKEDLDVPYKVSMPDDKAPSSKAPSSKERPESKATASSKDAPQKEAPRAKEAPQPADRNTQAPEDKGRDRKGDSSERATGDSAGDKRSASDHWSTENSPESASDTTDRPPSKLEPGSFHEPVEPGGHILTEFEKDLEGKNRAEEKAGETRRQEELEHSRHRLEQLRGFLDKSGPQYSKRQVMSLITEHSILDLQVLKRHGLELPGFFTKRKEFYHNVIAAIDKFNGDWRKGQQSLAPRDEPGTATEIVKARQREQRAEDAGFEGYGSARQSVVAGAAASVMRLFTDDPEKIAAASKLGAAISGAGGAWAQRKAQQGTYSPEVEGPGPFDSPVGKWRYGRAAGTTDTPPKSGTPSPAKPRAADAKTTDAISSDAKSTPPKDVGQQGTEPFGPPRPKEPPLPPTNMPWRDKWDFYYQHRADYPPHIRQMLDRIQNRTQKQQPEVDSAIREAYAEQLSQQWGIPIKTTERIPMQHHPSKPTQETSGGDWEKTNISIRTGERPNLSAVSTTKSGAEVQIDDFNPARRVAREYKASLEIRGKDPRVAEREIQERMERHAEFAQDRGLTAYEWVAHSPKSEQIMTKALADLKGKAQSISDEKLREKLLERYKKIHIVEEPFLDR